MISRQHVCDYQVFSNPYTGLAAMILFQAYFDLETLGDRESFIVREEVVSKEKLRKFFCSKWATVLASNCGLNETELSDYVKRRLNNIS